MSANRRFFVDTNVLVYAYDRSEPLKQIRAFEVLDDLAHLGLGLLSTQF
jgi:predicted nucleic acid-binding protein